jgi:phospho-N-acetylmuramoyl-pentapeptide-transferase
MNPALIWQLLGVAAVVLGLTLLCGLIGLPLLRRMRVGQTVRDDGPGSHLVKNGTPTFGGFFFIIPLTLLGLFAFWRGGSWTTLGILVLLLLAFTLIGFLDDLIKVRVSKKGLSVRQKSLLILVFSLAFAIWYLYLAPEPAFFLLPVSGQRLPILGWWRLPYTVFVVLVLYFTTNSVNLTDGVDGLAASVTVLSSLALALAGLILGASDPATWSAMLLAVGLAAACLGFLAFNHHPARVFMGDTGSMALGAGLTGVALMYGAPWLILFLGFIYVAESASVMIQVAYFRRTGGRRIFRMSPIHHHFELGGWSENKIVLIFGLITLAGCLIGLLLL